MNDFVPVLHPAQVWLFVLIRDGRLEAIKAYITRKTWRWRDKMPILTVIRYILKG